MTTNECSYCRGSMVDEDGRTPGFGKLCLGCLIGELQKEDGPQSFYAGLSWDEKHTYAFLCPKCGGSGHYYAGTRVTGSECFACIGYGFILREREEIQRTARWWQTYQRNRVVDSQTTTKRQEN
jgi:hypothetical protein